MFFVLFIKVCELNIKKICFFKLKTKLKCLMCFKLLIFNNASLNSYHFFVLFKIMGLKVNTDSFVIVFLHSNIVAFTELS